MEGSSITSSAEDVDAVTRGDVSRHMPFRVNRSTRVVHPAATSDCGCSMFALAKTSTRSSPPIRSRSRPEAPNVSDARFPDARS
jgi:hypothetical protein